MQLCEPSTPVARKLHIFLIFCVAFGGCLYGYNIGAMSGTLLFIKQDIVASPLDTSLFVASFLLGVSLVMIITGFLADVIGRKRILIASAIIAIISILITLSAGNIVLLTISRFMIGLSSGMILVTTPMYISESIPPSLRGRGTMSFQLCLAFGILASTAISFFYHNTANWQAIFALELIPAILLLFIYSFTAESPRWLATKNHDAKALAVLLKTNTKKIAEETLAAIKSTPSATKTSLFSIIRNRSFLPILIVVSLIGVLNQLTGINSILQYDSIILTKAGFHKHDMALIGSIIITAINFIMTAIAIMFVDKIERKKLLRIGLIGIIICLLTASLANYLLPNAHLRGIIITAAILGYIAFFALSPGALIWTLISENLPSRIRSIGMATALFLSSMFGSLLAAVFLPLERSIGFGGIFLFCSAAAIVYFFITFLIPDTSGKTLEEIELCALAKKSTGTNKC